ncbi:MAG: hypothetical protein U1A77_24400 [Pirellulales bacterium]
MPFRGHFTCLLAAATALFLSWHSSPVRAQQVTSTVPGYRVGDSFHEMFGLHWGFSRSGPGGGVFFDNGGFGGATPAFGGFDPNSAARFGFARGGTNGGFFLDFIASQGSNRSIVSQSPILTLPNGGAGAFYNSSLTPFVTGWVPVVGQSPLEERLSRLRQGDRGGPRDPDAATSAPQATDADPTVPPPAPEAAVEKVDAAADVPGKPNEGKPAVRSTRVYAPESLSLGKSSREVDSRGASDPGASGDGGVASNPTASTAAKGDLSVAEIRRRQAQETAERNDEVEQLVAKAREAESLGKGGVARIYYQQASRRATGARQQELAAKLRELTRQ